MAPEDLHVEESLVDFEASDLFRLDSLQGHHLSGDCASIFQASDPNGLRLDAQ